MRCNSLRCSGFAISQNGPRIAVIHASSRKPPDCTRKPQHQHGMGGRAVVPAQPDSWGYIPKLYRRAEDSQRKTACKRRENYFWYGWWLFRTTPSQKPCISLAQWWPNESMQLPGIILLKIFPNLSKKIKIYIFSIYVHRKHKVYVPHCCETTNAFVSPAFSHGREWYWAWNKCFFFCFHHLQLYMCEYHSSQL